MCQFDSLPADAEGANPLNVETIILGLGSYLFPVNSMSKQKHTIPCGMRNLCDLKVRQYADRLIDLNEYLASLPRETLTEKVGVTELNA